MRLGVVASALGIDDLAGRRGAGLRDLLRERPDFPAAVARRRAQQLERVLAREVEPLTEHSDRALDHDRNGNALTFFILGPGYGNVRSVAVETVSDPGLLPKRTLALDSEPYVGPRLWTKFLSLHPIDLHVQVADPTGLSCPALKALLASIDADLDDPYFSVTTTFEVELALHAFRSTVKDLLDKCSTQPPDVNATFVWSRFSSNEVAGSGRFTGPPTSFSAVRVVLPSGFAISNHLCPSQLPSAIISGNRIDCGGGLISTGQNFTLNLQTSPSPPAGIGGQLFGIANGTTFGPFTITGP